MTYEEVIGLGWDDRHHKDKETTRSFCIEEESGGRWLLGMSLKTDEQGLHNMVIIKWVEPDVLKNEWENSETNFYGSLKTADDLKNVMRYLGIIEY